MLGYRWGYWNYPGGCWTFPRSPFSLYQLPFNSYFEGTCASYSALDLKLLDDEELRENVIINLYDDLRIPRSDKQDIEVKVENKIVYLEGTIRHPQTKVHAYADALNTPGVADVNNHLKLVWLA